MPGAWNQLATQAELNAVKPPRICYSHSVVIARRSDDTKAAFERADQASTSSVVGVLAKKLDAARNEAITKGIARYTRLAQSI